MIESEYNHIPKEIRDNPRLCELYKHGFDSGKIQFSYIPDLHDHMESEAYGKGLMAGKEAAIIFKLKYGNYIRNRCKMRLKIMDDLKKIILEELKGYPQDANSLIFTIQREYHEFDYTKGEIYKALDQLELKDKIEVNTSDWKCYIKCR